jgi:hypothetical protein
VLRINFGLIDRAGINKALFPTWSLKEICQDTGKKSKARLFVKVLDACSAAFHENAARHFQGLL